MALTGSKVRRSLVLIGRGMRDEPVVYFWAVLSSGFFGALTVFVARAVGWVTDTVVLPALSGDVAAQGRWWVAGLLLLGIAVTLALSVAGRRIVAGLGYANLQAHHRTRVTRQYLRLPMAWHRQHPAGQLLSNANSDVEAATGVFNPLPFALGVVVMLFVAFGTLISVDPWITLAAFTIIPIVIAVNAIFQRRMSPAITHAQQLRAEVSDVAHESFEAALVVKSLGTADREEERFAAKADELRRANVRVGVVRAYFDPVIDALPNLGSLLVVVVGMIRLAAGEVEPGEVVAAAYLLTLLAVPVRAFGWVLGELPRALVGYERISRVVDAGGSLVEGTATLPAAAGPARVELRGVTVEVPTPRGPLALLHDIDLVLEPGRTVALVGATGSGKTTLASTVCRLLDPARGEVLLDGVDVRELSPDARTGAMTLVSQSTFVFEDTVRENVTLADPGDPAAPSDDDVWEALEAAHVADVVRGLEGGLDAPLGERGANLSGGQRQRIAIARALVRRPRVLVMDDATSAVDPRVERRILASLGEDDGSRPTVLLVAYRMSSVLLADEVVHLEAGRIVDRGTHAELLARDPGYAELATAYERDTERRAREAAEQAGDVEPEVTR
ncbi:MAG: ABC transporter ATP-binding protein [Actinomycetales bacterium]|nr:ABC transporter ATP-binding protein [Actinomycetales bacterium]